MESSISIKNKQVIETARAAFASGRTRPLNFRLTQLQNLYKMIDENLDEMLEALKLDLRKAKHEAILYELNYLQIDISKMIGICKDLTTNEKLPPNCLTPFDHGYVQKEPYGVVLIIAPWNYPFLLILQPLLGAIAAGNVVILKPSEYAPNTARFIAEKIPKYLDHECFQVVTGAAPETIDLLKNKFDYIFFTGSTEVGRKVLMAAAPHLTPCTLELGGKSPCYIDDSADFKIAAKRIVWAKCVNLGQTCIAPDYILCSKSAENEFIKTAKEVLKEWYGDNPQACPDLPRIINEGHFQRLKNLVDSTTGRVVVGGKMDAKDLWIEPTIIGNTARFIARFNFTPDKSAVELAESDKVMQEEIFGPILPIVTVNSIDEAIKFILKRPKPLSVYAFTLKEKETKKLLDLVSSGGVCVNDCLWQNVWEGLPFGGVGESGMGNYHGKYSFDTFSHSKPILHRGVGYLSEKLGEPRYPPYTDGKLKNLVWAAFGALAVLTFYWIRSL